MKDAEATIYLIEQSGTQVGELSRRDERVRAQTVVLQQLGQVQTLREKRMEKNASDTAKPITNMRSGITT